ncbi:MAG: hypothetical protein ACQ9MH_15695 [Nitrospinales bacterium]
MWICLNNAFISAVQHRDKPDCFMVRKRKREHLEIVFPDAGIMEMGFADYRWRVAVSKSVSDHELHEKYTRIWSLM